MSRRMISGFNVRAEVSRACPSPTQPINAFAPVYGGAVPPLPGDFNADFTQERYGERLIAALKSFAAKEPEPAHK